MNRIRLLMSWWFRREAVIAIEDALSGEVEVVEIHKCGKWVEEEVCRKMWAEG